MVIEFPERRKWLTYGVGRGCDRHGNARNDEDSICDRKFQRKMEESTGRAGSGEVGLAEDVYPDDKSLEGDVYENEEEF